jgi:HicA toxin of bacterial toxin-antitoxin,
MTECRRERRNSYVFLDGSARGARGIGEVMEFTPESKQGYSLSSTVCYYLPMKVRDVLRLLRDDGWFIVATRGSHRKFEHPLKTERVTVAG